MAYPLTIRKTQGLPWSARCHAARLAGAADTVSAMKTWTDEMIALLGTESDTALGDRWGMSRMTVARKRQTLAIAPTT